jgi:hypothetical protein
VYQFVGRQREFEPTVAERTGTAELEVAETGTLATVFGRDEPGEIVSTDDTVILTLVPKKPGYVNEIQSTLHNNTEWGRCLDAVHYPVDDHEFAVAPDVPVKGRVEVVDVVGVTMPVSVHHNSHYAERIEQSVERKFRDVIVMAKRSGKKRVVVDQSLYRACSWRYSVSTLRRAARGVPIRVVFAATDPNDNLRLRRYMRGCAPSGRDFWQSCTKR